MERPTLRYRVAALLSVLFRLSEAIHISQATRSNCRFVTSRQRPFARRGLQSWAHISVRKEVSTAPSRTPLRAGMSSSFCGELLDQVPSFILPLADASVDMRMAICSCAICCVNVGTSGTALRFSRAGLTCGN